MTRPVMHGGFWLANALVMAYALMPVVWILSLSLKPPGELPLGRFWPRQPTLAHYRAVFSDAQFPPALWNSLGIGLIATVLCIALALTVAYALVRLPMGGKHWVLGTALAVAMFPPVALVGPLFELWRGLGLYDTWAGLIIPYLSLGLPLAIWTLTAFLRQLPWELEQAARMDGASPWQAFSRILLPLLAPGVAAAGVLVFLFIWNDFLFAAALSSTDRARTVPVAIAYFTGSSRFEQPAGSIAAASVVVTLPALMVVALLQRRLMAGLTTGAVKS